MTVLRNLRADQSGAMLIETALIAPALMLLSVGAFQVSELVARQHMLQSAAPEAEQIALASKPDTQAKLDTMQSILASTTGLSSSHIALSFQYRCNTDAAMVSSSSSCGSQPAWNFDHIVLTDTYSPVWTAYGVGQNISLTVDRNVQIS